MKKYNFVKTKTKTNMKTEFFRPPNPETAPPVPETPTKEPEVQPSEPNQKPGKGDDPWNVPTPKVQPQPKA